MPTVLPALDTLYVGTLKCGPGLSANAIPGLPKKDEIGIGKRGLVASIPWTASDVCASAF